MQATNEVIAKRIRVINQIAKDINEMHDEPLPMQGKYHEMMYFICEMLRAATGLADLEEEAMTYGNW